MKQNYGRIPENARGAVPMIVGEGRRILQQSARRAGRTAQRVARSGRRIVGSTVHQAEVITKRHPWGGLGTAVGAGFLLGGLCAFLFYRGR
jgi:ElaB/YqjD/DUF883 family membrane-anchored ribosome-binding protein